jgi:3-hydroxyisobutyrate dehydrogenase-like beta-hydroxyacid dehydrogenase
MKIGFIGLGGMGSAIAANIVRMGHQVTVWNRSSGPARALAQQGATAAVKPEEALQGELLFSMLASDAAMRDVGLDGPLLDKATRGLLHVNLATVSVAFARELSRAHAEHGLGYIASPVFGRPDAAATAKLVVVAAGPANDVERARPVLEKIGQRLAVVGELPEMASLFKIAGNFMIASAIETMGEAVALLRKGNVDPAVFVEVLTNSLFAAPVYRGYGTIIVGQKYEPAGFALRLGYKDAGLTLAAANELEAPLPVASLLHDHFLEAMAAGWAEKDWSALAHLAASKAGLTV